MIQVPIQAVPNQEITFQDGEDIYVLQFRFTGDAIVANALLNDEFLIQGILVNPYVPIIQYKEGSNFVINTQDNDLVDYTKFNDTQELFFLEEGIDI